MQYGSVDHLSFYEALCAAAAERSSIRKSLAFYPLERYAEMRLFLHYDRKSGYAITIKGKLVNVFSSEKGRGDELVTDAKLQGAVYLKAFDGYLPAFYTKHGFREDFREPNWSPSGPDVITMRLMTDISVHITLKG